MVKFSVAVCCLCFCVLPSSIDFSYCAGVSALFGAIKFESEQLFEPEQTRGESAKQGGRVSISDRASQQRESAQGQGGPARD